VRRLDDDEEKDLHELSDAAVEITPFDRLVTGSIDTIQSVPFVSLVAGFCVKSSPTTT
jgi:hypothetical protein